MLDNPNIVLVHGALTDASVWSATALRLQRSGFPTFAPAMPLRGLKSDAEYLSAFLETLSEPYVLVGHSYGGSVISHPMLANKQLRSLVFVSAFIPDDGESAGDLNARWPGSKLNESTTTVRAYPGGQELYLKPEAFGEVYAADLPVDQIAILAAAQRPIDLRALGESFTAEPTWRQTPSWALVSSKDNSIPPDAQRSMAERARASVVEVDSSHASPLSHSETVSALIESASR